MPSKRERLNQLTAALWDEVDRLTGGQDNDSIAAVTDDLSACVDAIQQIDASIAALEAVANRTAVQNAELRSLRLHKDAAQRQRVALRRQRQLSRNWVRLARFALLLDGSRARQSDVAGDE